MDSSEPNDQFDVIVAGAGISGALAALRLAIGHAGSSAGRQPPRILLLEKETVPGGRLRSLDTGTGTTADDATSLNGWGYGLNGVSANLLQFWQKTMQADPDSEWDPMAVGARAQTRFGILSGSDLNIQPIDQMFASKGARALGGMAAARQWTCVDEILQQGKVSAATNDVIQDASEEESTALDAAEEGATVNTAAKEQEVTTTRGSAKVFAQAWPESRKAPAAVVLEQYCPAIGITDLWSTPTDAFCQRVEYHTSSLKRGPWQTAVMDALAKYIEAGVITLVTDSRVLSAQFEGQLPDPAKTAAKDAGNGCWTLKTSTGDYRCRRLIVAQSPWQAIMWLPKHYWPASLLAVASKVKPVSAVTLTEKVDGGIAAGMTEDDIPDLVVIPSENVQAIRSSNSEITFQATIDYEISVQAPEVVKAVKRLKRARKKFLSARPGSLTENERIALVPVAWSQSTSVNESRLIERMAKSKISSANLAFCGDSYGASYIGDANVIKSVVNATNIIGQSLQP